MKLLKQSLALLLYFTAHSLYGQTDSVKTVFSSDVQEIMKISVQKSKEEEVSIAGRFSQTQEQAPAIVSVITKEDIKNWGARDVGDILRLLPGFEFGIDVQSLFGLGFRGMWGHEGKALLMIDNKIVNCFGYGNTNFFGTYPAAMIERIEIIRGPGSAIYGGFAEIAVINIITPRGSQYNGVQVNSNVGSFGGADNGLTFNGNIGVGVRKNDLEVSVQAGYNYTPNSTGIYKDFSGKTLQFGNEFSWRQWQHLIAKIQYKNFSLSYNRNETNYLAQTQFGSILPLVNGRPLNKLRHYTETVQMNYNTIIKGNWSGEILVDLTRGNPITARVVPQIAKDSAGNSIMPDASVLWENLSAKCYRAKTEIYITYDEQKFGRLMFGGGYQLEAANSMQLDGLPGFQNSANPADTVYWVTNPASYGFFQYTRQIKKFGLTLGSRYETTRFGAAFAPRIGLTFVSNNLNMKLLYGRAFRVPLLWQVYSRQYPYSQNSLIPEITDTFEFQVGYKFTPKLSAKINTYLIKIDKPITYIGADNSYQNFGEVGSYGIESELNYRDVNWGSFLNLSYNIPTNITSSVFLSADKQHFLGLPSLKVNAGVFVKVKNLTFSPTFSLLGERFGQFEQDASDLTRNTVYPAILLTNVNILYSFTKKLDLNLTVSNLFNTNYVLIQPYYGGHAPVPLNNRQIVFGLNWRFSGM
jgi:outer membrane cobalamin receptor